MAILFSFGFLFSSFISPNPSLGVPRVDSGSRFIAFDSYEATSMNKDVLGILKDQDIPTDVRLFAV